MPAAGLLARSVEDIRDRYDDPARPYVYHHTQRGYFAMLQDLFGVADAAPGADGGGPRVVNSEAPDPVRWYLYTRGWDPSRERYLENPAPPLDWLEAAEVVISSPRHLPEVRKRTRRDGRRLARGALSDAAGRRDHGLLSPGALGSLPGGGRTGRLALAAGSRRSAAPPAPPNDP